jgi:hypothetical protein
MNTEILFYLIFVISYIAMVIVDIVVAFYIPAQRVKKRLISEADEIAEKLGKPMAKHAWLGIKDDVSKTADKYFNKIENQIQNTVRTNIKIVNKRIKNVNKKMNTVLTNDVPHIIKKKMVPLFNKKVTEIDRLMVDRLNQSLDVINQQIESQIKELNDKIEPLSADMRRALSSAGVAGKSKKVTERLYKEQALIRLNPEKRRHLELVKIGRSAMKTPLKRYDQYLDFLLYNELEKSGGRKGDEEKENITICSEGDEGPAGDLETAFGLQEETETERREMESVGLTAPLTITEAQAKKQCAQWLRAAGVPKSEVEKSIKKGEEAREKRKKEEKEYANKTKEKAQWGSEAVVPDNSGDGDLQSDKQSSGEADTNTH